MPKNREHIQRPQQWESQLPLPGTDPAALTNSVIEQNEAEERFLWLMNIVTDPVLLLSENRVMLANSAAADLFGAQEAGQLTERQIPDLLPMQHGQHRQIIARALHSYRRKPLFIERTLMRLDGTPVHAMVVENPCYYRDRPAVLLLVREASRQGNLSLHVDTITGLPDHIQFRERLKRAISGAIAHGQLIALVRLAIDNFRHINALLGHENGDVVLQKVAQCLVSSVREHDMVTRLGGDEFGILLEGLVSPDEAGSTVQRLLDALARPLRIGSQEFSITASIGIAFSPTDAADHDRLLQRAEVALSHAKGRAGHTWQRYLPDLENGSREHKGDRTEIKQRYARLTLREREVLDLLVAGKANKMIGYLLGTSSRTIENHRARVMDKMQARSLPELVQMVLDLRGR